MSKWIKNTGNKPNVGERAYEVQLRDATVLPSDDEGTLYSDFDWSLEGVSRDIIEWRFTDPNPQLDSPVEIYTPKVSTLSQGEVQQLLLHFLRESLKSTTIDKNYCKRLAKNLWQHCDKEETRTAHIFEDFSDVNSNYKKFKQKEKSIVNLITKLKGLQ